ncbi:MAG TPA: hypothetical protein VGP93_12890 [Polyangiaceae bacterium]|nr:hypothetical protein [Polyangiaceae bacterium]
MLLNRAAFAVLVALSCGFALACGSAASSEDPTPGPAECGRIVEEGGGGIPDPPNGASLCPAGVCNYQSQAGCPSDQACRPSYTADMTGVEPGCQVAGSGKTGDSCSDWSDCAAGYLCALGQCRKLCCGDDWSECDAGESCIRQLELQLGSENVPSGADLCFPVGTCDVLDAAACSDQPGRDCKLVDPTGAEACAPASPEALGEACSGPSVCQRGLTCVGGVCRRLCRAEACGDPACMPDEGACVHFDRDPAGVGECTPGW